MKKIFLIITIIVSGNLFSQKMMTRSGEIKFEASMPALEEVAAKNNTASCIFDQTSGEFVTLALVKAFKFKVPLMEEHFNENYIESTTYPKATFKGKVIGFDAKKLVSNKATAFVIEGDLTLHGVTKPVKTKIYFTQNGAKLGAKSSFTIKNEDYKIKIPSLVKNKIAEEVKIDLNFDLEEKK